MIHKKLQAFLGCQENSIYQHIELESYVISVYVKYTHYDQ